MRHGNALCGIGLCVCLSVCHALTVESLIFRFSYAGISPEYLSQVRVSRKQRLFAFYKIQVKDKVTGGKSYLVE